MSTRMKWFLAVLLSACAAAAYADPPGRVARLNYTAGPVSFAPADAPDAWMQAVLNRPLTTGDRIWADDAARAEIHLGSTAIRLDALTSLDFLNVDDRTLQMRLAQGAINLRVRDIAPGDVVEIATPSGAVLVRQPGSYRISAEPQSDTARVLVSFGQAEVVTPLQTVTVPSGQSAMLSQQAISFEIAAYASGDDFDRWSAERDRREDRASSTRYVSREMTGYEDLDQYGTWRTLPEYGAVWVPARVASGWAPYRQGHWAWVSPWGWTWIDDAPWGFAPFHYGRWVWTGGYWAWAPGAVVRRPVYAPALVAFVGGSRWSASVSSGPAVGWFPLGYREPYRPWYRASEAHVRNVNVTHVTNITNVYNTSNVTYVNRTNPQAVTVVPQQAFVSARPVAASSVPVAAADLARADVAQAAPPAQPVRASFAADRGGRRPPAQALAREVVAVNPPAQAAALTSAPAQEATVSSNPRRFEHEGRVRVIGREDARGERFRGQALQAAPAAAAPQGSAPAPAAAAAIPAPAAAVAGPAVATPGAAVAGPAAAVSAARPTAPGAGAPAAVTTQPPPAQGSRRYSSEERRSAPRESGPAARTFSSAPPSASAPAAAVSSTATATVSSSPAATVSSAPAAAPVAPAPRVDHRAGPQLEQERAAQREHIRQERAAERAARAAAAPEARPAARAEERRQPRSDDAPRARPAAPQPGQGATIAPSPQRELRSAERAQPAPAAAPRAAEPPRPAAHEHRRPHPAQP